MLSLFLIMLAVLSCAALVTYLIQHDDGFILISFGQFSIEVRFWFGVILITLCACLLIWLIKRIKTLVVSMGVALNWWSESRFKKAKSNTHKGLIHFIEGNFSVAKKELLSATKYLDDPFLHYLASAESAIALKNIEEAEFLLDKAEPHSGSHVHYIQFCRARCDYLSGRLSESIQKLEQLLKEEKHNKQILRLLCRVLINDNRFKRIIALLPVFTKLSVFDQKEFESIELNAYLSYFTQQLIQTGASIDEKKTVLFRFWEMLPKKLKHNEKILNRYAKELEKAGLIDEAESLLFSELNQRWSDTLIVVYGNLLCTDTKRHFEHVQKWAKSQSENALYLLAAGKIALRNKLWGQAKDYVESSARIEPSLEAFITLAKIYKQLNDGDKEKECLQQSVSFLEKKY